MTNARNLARLIVDSGGAIPSGSMPAGSVIQVVQSVKTDSQSTTSTSFVDVSDLSVQITPQNASNKILVKVALNNIGQNSNSIVGFNLLRNGSQVISNTSGGFADTNNAWVFAGGANHSAPSRQLNSAFLDYLDSPSSTSNLTYKIQMKVSGGTGSLNRWALNTDNGAVSTITLMEIAG